MLSLFHFFFTHTPTPEIYTLSLHDALPISARAHWREKNEKNKALRGLIITSYGAHSSIKSMAQVIDARSEEHTSELQSRGHLVCRLLLEKKKKTETRTTQTI